MTGDELKALRQRWGMTQEKFARVLEIPDRCRVSDLELGKRKIKPWLEKMIRLITPAMERARKRGMAGDDQKLS